VVSNSFFGIMIHLLVHLIKDFNIFGPIGAIDVIPLNMFFEMLFVKQMKTKGDHLMQYMYVETLGFCIKYLSLYKHAHKWLRDPKEEKTNASEVFQGMTRKK
jgi:hypothetical protein